VSALGILRAKLFESGRLGGGGEGEVGGVAAHLAGRHALADLRFVVFEDLKEGVLVVAVVLTTEGHVELVGSLTALGGVRLVDDDGEGFVAHVGDAIDDEGELLDGGGDQLLAVLEVGAEIGGAVGVGEEVLHLGELADVPVDLAVEDAAVGDDDDRIEEVVLAGFVVEFDKLVAQPGDGVGLA
jgi:hypothetical protein